MIVLDTVVIYSFFYDLLIALLLIFRCIRDLHADLLSLALRTFIYFHFILSWQSTHEFKYNKKLLAMQKI